MESNRNISILQGKEKACYITGRKDILHKHHVFGGKNRAISDKHGLWVWLIPYLHNMSNQGVHFNKELDTKIKQECQRAFEEKYTHLRFVELIGKNYL